MKKFILTLMAVCAISLTVFSQKPDMGDGPSKQVESQRVYRIFANNETNSDLIRSMNDSLKVRGVGNDRGLFAGLGIAIAKSYGTAFIQKTVSASSNLIGMMINLVTKNKRDREQWLKTSNQQCHFQHRLATEVFIDDFYYLPSANGALDPMNIKFTGFGCKSSLRPFDVNPKPETLAKTSRSSNDVNGQQKEKYEMDREAGGDNGELLEFFVTCKLREDSIGLNRIANHSKFEVVLDQFVFDTRHSCLPNDSTSGLKLRPFDFSGRKDFVFNMNVKVFSSWVNEAIMLFDNQQIGEFNITVRIDTSDLNEDRIFIYNPYNPRHRDTLVSVTGECFLVPRSYTGTANSPSWGTGQYRLEMTINENCSVNEKWYQKSDNKVKSGKKSKQGKMRKPKWDNKKWRPEWKEMQNRKQSKMAWNKVWHSVTTAYIGNDWVQELVSPFTTAVSTQETVALGKLLDGNNSTGTGTSNSNVPAAAGAAMPEAPISPAMSAPGRKK